MAIERARHIKELYDLNHINDKEIHKGFDYENNLTKRLTSRYLINNPTTNEFLKQFQQLLVWMIESVLVVRNYHNYTVDKHYNKHPN